VQILTAENFGNSKESIAYKGPSGTAKTTKLATWPTPIKVAYFDRNLKTIGTLIKAGLDCEVFVFDTFKEFDAGFVQPVKRREFDAQSIGVDTVDFMAAMCQREIQGNKPRMTQPNWGTLLNSLRAAIDTLTSATAPIDGKPSYNVILNYHLIDVTNEDGALLKTAPKIQGSFKDELEAFIDTVLYCTSGTSSSLVKQPTGEMKMVPTKQFLCHTVPPNPFITCKGGGLPPTIEGCYPSLRKAWDGKEGVPSE